MHPSGSGFFYIRAATGNFPLGPKTYFHQRLTVVPGRLPSLFSKVLDNAVTRAAGLSSRVKDDEKITGLADNVVEAVNGVKAMRSTRWHRDL